MERVKKFINLCKDIFLDFLNTLILGENSKFWVKYVNFGLNTLFLGENGYSWVKNIIFWVNYYFVG